MICLHENHQEKDQTSGFYTGLPDTHDADFTFFFPFALTTFIHGQLGTLRPGLQDNTAFESTQTTEKRSSEMGSLYARLPDSTEFVHLAITRMAISATHKTDGIDLEILGELKSCGKGPWVGKPTDQTFDHDQEYRLDISCTINRETSEFRYNGGISQEGTQSGLSRYYPGDEVQTDLGNLNLKHPLIYNTGGLYALSNEGVHAIDLAGPTRIQPVKLRGWGWGSVYESDTVWGRNELNLPFLKKSFLEQHLDAMGVLEGDVLRSYLSLRDGNMGFYVEDASEKQLQTSSALNRREIESIDISFNVDRFGLAMGIDAKLSRVLETSRTDNTKPLQGPRYTKSLMLPWEVLICRDFELPKFTRYWYGQRLQSKYNFKSSYSSSLKEKIRNVIMEKPKELPYRIKNL